MQIQRDFVEIAVSFFKNFDEGSAVGAAGFGHDLKIGLPVQERAQPKPDDFVVIYNQDSLSCHWLSKYPLA